MVLVAVGVVFELPAVIVTLVRLGILSSTIAAHATAAIGYAIVAAIAVALPGVDPVTTTLEMVPLMLLFEALDLALGRSSSGGGARRSQSARS